MAYDGEIIVMAISEHVENAGTHSGDATMVLPAQDINNETRTNIESIATAVAKALNVSGNTTVRLSLIFAVKFWCIVSSKSAYHPLPFSFPQLYVCVEFRYMQDNFLCSTINTVHVLCYRCNCIHTYFCIN